MKRLLIFLAFITSIQLAFAQNLYVPLEYQKALQNGTRSLTGAPGKNYWINHSDYTIEANFNPMTGALTGTEKIKYHNNSPDTLKMIIIRLYQNVWKKGVSRDFMLPESAITNGEKIKSLNIDGQNYSTDKLRYYNTLVFIRLKKPILPHSTADLQISWETQMPLKMSMRYGKYGDRTFFVGYWYPEIAVYDDVMGWDRRNFTGIQEFHNDHNNFDVRINVMFPNLVWAPGKLVNADSIYTDKILKRIDKASKSDKVIHIITKDDLNGNLLKQKGIIQWHFIAKSIPEFPFATSDHYVWDATSLKVKNRRVFISAVYNPQNTTFNYMADLVRKIIYQDSYVVLKIPFPYEAETIFNGGGAMEFPMMVNETVFKDTCENYYVTAHEVSHTYFPFMTGTNETMYAWMDEGIINYFPRYVAQNIGSHCNKYFTNMINKYKRLAGTSNDLPINIPTSDVGNWDAYRHIAYNKPSLAFYVLTDYLGKDLFFKALREYAMRWKYKHPYPWDFFFSFNNITGKNLNWFWQKYFFTFAYPDLAIDSYKYENGKLTVNIKNKGGLPIPVDLTIIKANGQKQTVSRKIDVWENNDKLTISIQLKQKPKKLILENRLGADIILNNSTVTCN